MSELPDWFNAGFILTLTGMIGGGISYILIFCLKSRCSNIKCCGCEINRIPIPVEDLNRVTLDQP